MDPQLQYFAELAGYAGAIGGSLAAGAKLAQVVKVRAYDPSKQFIQRIGTTMDTVEQIKKELGDNGGKSLKDSVKKIDDRTRMTDARQSALMAAQPEAMFEANIEGHFTSANRAFEELSGFSRAHLSGMEWVNAIHPEDRFRVVKEWNHAVKDQRAWIDNCRMVTASGRVLLVRIEAHPMRESIGDRVVVGWHGTVCVEQHG